jgi:copper chaperone CopZ
MLKTLSVHCPDIVCEGCARAIKRSLSAAQGVQAVDVAVAEKAVTVQYHAEQTSGAALRERLNRAGFPPR